MKKKHVRAPAELKAWAEAESAHFAAQSFQRDLKNHYRDKYASQVSAAIQRSYCADWFNTVRLERIDIYDIRPFVQYGLGEILTCGWAHGALWKNTVELLFYLPLSKLIQLTFDDYYNFECIMKCLFKAVTMTELRQNTGEESAFLYFVRRMPHQILVVLEEDSLPLTYDWQLIQNKITTVLNCAKIHVCYVRRNHHASLLEGFEPNQSVLASDLLSCDVEITLPFNTQWQAEKALSGAALLPALPQQFVPRTTCIQRLAELLDKQRLGMKGVLIVGTSGSGKTELIKQFLHHKSKELVRRGLYNIWIDAHSAQTIEQSIQNIKQPNGERYPSAIIDRYTSSEDLLCYCATAYSNTVIVFDDACNPTRSEQTSILIQSYLAKLAKTSAVVLISTQRKRSFSVTRFPVIDLSHGFKDENVSDYVCSVTGLPADHGVLEFLDYLDYMPLAVSVAAFFIKAANASRQEVHEPKRYACFSDYLVELKKLDAYLAQEQDEFWQETGPILFKYRRTQDDVIRHAIKSLTEPERELLTFCSLLAGRQLPLELLKKYYQNLKNHNKWTTSVDKVIPSLVQRCLLLVDETHEAGLTAMPTYKMHEVTRRVMQLSLFEEGRRKQLAIHKFDWMCATLIELMQSSLVTQWAGMLQYTLIHHLDTFIEICNRLDVVFSDKEKLLQACSQFKQCVATTLLTYFGNGKKTLDLVKGLDQASPGVIFLVTRANLMLSKDETFLKTIRDALFDDSGPNLNLLIEQQPLYFPNQARFYWEKYGFTEVFNYYYKTLKKKPSEYRLLPLTVYCAAKLDKADIVKNCVERCINQPLIGEMIRFVVLYIGAWFYSESNKHNKKLLQSLCDCKVNTITPLMFAAMCGHVTIVRQCLKQGSQVNQKTQSGSSALMLAVRFRQIEVAQVLLEQSADPNSQDQDGNSALMFACWNGHRTMVNLLLAKGANLDLRNHKGETLLNGLCRDGSVNVIEFLLAQGANPNIVDNEGNSPLLTACRFHHRSVVIALIKHGGQLDWKNKKQETALTIAETRGHSKLVDLLKQAIAGKLNSDFSSGELYSLTPTDTQSLPLRTSGNPIIRTQSFVHPQQEKMAPEQPTPTASQPT